MRDTERRSLLFQVFIVNASLVAVGVLVLAFTPVSISTSITSEQAEVLLIGFVALLLGNVLLLRRSLKPLRQLTSLMDGIERPGALERLSEVPRRDSDVAALTDAFGEMLGRLERERLQSRRVAIAAQEEERARIARELHDEIGQTLTAIALEAERAREQHPQNGGARIDEWAERALDQLRRIGRELRPEALDDLGLVNALIALCTRVSDQSGLEVERHFENARLPEHPEELDLVVYRVAQESLTNIARHADASRVEIALQPGPDSVVLRVIDDGRGIPTPDPFALNGHGGLRGMRERALLVGGALAVKRGSEGGVEVRLEVPAGEG
jgi:two-component system sensor histidine kinase UhpB